MQPAFRLLRLDALAIEHLCDHALMLRGSRDFASRTDYDLFLKRLLAQLNAGRRERLAEELTKLRALPARRLEACKRLPARVDSGSLVHIDRNTYSVPSRLIGERVEVRMYVEHLEVWYARTRTDGRLLTAYPPS